MPWFMLAPLIYAAAVLQMWLAPSWQIDGACPDLLALIAFGFVVVSRPKRALGLVVCAAVGLASDLSTVGPLGLGMSIFALAGAAILWLDTQFRLERLPGQLAMVWLAVTGVTIVEGTALKLIGQAGITFGVLLERTSLVGLYTLAIALPVLMIAAWRRPSAAQFS